MAATTDADINDTDVFFANDSRENTKCGAMQRTASEIGTGTLLCGAARAMRPFDIQIIATTSARSRAALSACLCTLTACTLGTTMAHGSDRASAWRWGSSWGALWDRSWAAALGTATGARWGSAAMRAAPEYHNRNIPSCQPAVISDLLTTEEVRLPAAAAAAAGPVCPEAAETAAAAAAAAPDFPLTNNISSFGHDGSYDFHKCCPRQSLESWTTTCAHQCNLRTRSARRVGSGLRCEAGQTSRPIRPVRAPTARRVGADAQREARICSPGRAPENPEIPDPPTPAHRSGGCVLRIGDVTRCMPERTEGDAMMHELPPPKRRRKSRAAADGAGAGSASGSKPAAPPPAAGGSPPGGSAGRRGPDMDWRRAHYSMQRNGRSTDAGSVVSPCSLQRVR
eukprot:gene20704-biopygen13125